MASPSTSEWTYRTVTLTDPVVEPPAGTVPSPWVYVTVTLSNVVPVEMVLSGGVWVQPVELAFNNGAWT